MKKVFTLLLAAVMAVAAHAQVMFADPDGNVYDDGQTMRLLVYEDPDWGEIMCPAPLLVNKGSQAVNVQLDVDITQLPQGTSIADCFSGKCDTYTALGKHTTKSIALAAGATQSIAIEWNSFSQSDWTPVYGQAVMVCALYVNGTKDKTVTVVFSNPDPAHVASLQALAGKQPLFTLDGRRAAPHAKGLLICNGRKMYVK